MRKLSTIISLFFMIACNNQENENRNVELSGMYKLVIAENQDSLGVWHEDPWTAGASGYIIYDGKGHMAVQINRKGYNDYEWLPEEQSLRDEYVDQKLDSMTNDQLKEAVKAFASSYVYVGNYTIDDTADVVNHHRISTTIHSPVGSVVRRAFEFNGDTVILRILNGNRRLKWVKQP